jgi:dimethylhistidine N-methyltransferase
MSNASEMRHAQEELAAHLGAADAAISPKYFYDALGSRLFELITLLPEYYPTRTERALMQHNAAAMAAAIGSGVTLIDLGAGNGEKAEALFETLSPSQYVAVDISTEFTQQAVAALRRRHPAIDMCAVGADLSRPFDLPRAVLGHKRLFFYPGSSLGNFDPPEALALLQHVRRLCGGDGGLLIGIDLVKDTAVLEAAYNDELGITAAFNLNLLNHVNRVLGSDFSARDWLHHARYASAHSRIEMYLEARRDLQVRWAGGSRRFRAGERIHTENSYKYRLAEFETQLRRAGFAAVRSWTDPAHWFAVCHATV